MKQAVIALFAEMECRAELDQFDRPSFLPI
jgi:hypothetical protein